MKAVKTVLMQKQEIALNLKGINLGK